MRCIDSTMLERENHLFDCTRSKPIQSSLPAGLTLASDFGFCFQCQAGSSLVLRRPIEITALIGQLKKWFAWASFRELHSAEPVGLLIHVFPHNYRPSFFLSIVDVSGKGYIAVNSPRPSKIQL